MLMFNDSHLVPGGRWGGGGRNKKQHCKAKGNMEVFNVFRGMQEEQIIGVLRTQAQKNHVLLLYVQGAKAAAKQDSSHEAVSVRAAS